MRMLTNKPKPIIYLAGKIGYADWRTQIFGSRFGAAPNDGKNSYGFDRVLDESLTHDCGSFHYGGPFFISCDHGCAHGPASHGAAPSGCLDGGADDGRIEMREQILHVNFARIRRADLVFAYINELDCFGTLVEVGFATALEKPIGVGIGRNITVEQFDDLWMPRGCHTVGQWLGTPRETFGDFLRRHGLELRTAA